jgi:hypothetical protein
MRWQPSNGRPWPGGAGGDAQAHLAAVTAASPRQLPFGQGFTGFMHVHWVEFHAVVDQDQNVILMRDSAALSCALGHGFNAVVIKVNADTGDP